MKILVALCLFAVSASAVSLYWGETRVKTASMGTCMAFAGDAMRLSGVQNIRKSPNEVAGTLGANYAAITCVQTAPNATAMVMVAGENNADTSRLRDLLRNKVAGMIRFD